MRPVIKLGPPRLKWPDEDSELAAVLPVIVRAGSTEQVVAPSERVGLSADMTHGLAVAIVPGSLPIVGRLEPDRAGTLTVPFPTQAVVQALDTARHASAQPSVSRLHFRLDSWTKRTPASVGIGSGELHLRLEADQLHLNPPNGGRTGPIGLVLEASSVPTRVVGVPPLGPGESAFVDLAHARPFGARPALLATDARTRLLLAYLNVGESHIARRLASRLVPALAQRRALAWSEPSLVQLGAGYSLALAGDGPGLEAWCRRASAHRLLGTDGLILQAYADWSAGRTRKARSRLIEASELGSPVLSVGLDLAVRLAFLVSHAKNWPMEDPGGDAIDQLIADYSALAARSDGFADTVTRTPEPRLPVSLEGRSTMTRISWRMRSLLSRLKLDHHIGQMDSVLADLDWLNGVDSRHRRPYEGVTISMRENDNATSSRASDPSGSPPPTMMRLLPRLFAALAGSLVVIWVALVVVLIISAMGFGTILWEPVMLAFAVVSAGVFTILGAGVASMRAGDQLTQARELRDRAEATERRARTVEDDAMKGRALAAALQAEALDPEVGSAASRHAQLSRSLFGSLVTSSELDPAGRKPAN